MNRSLPPILESAEELKTLLSKSRSKRVSERVHALYLIQSNQVRTRQEISSLLGRHRRTVGNWLALYEQEGLSGLLTLRTRPNNPLSLDDRELRQLRERLSHPEASAATSKSGTGSRSASRSRWATPPSINWCATACARS